MELDVRRQIRIYSQLKQCCVDHKFGCKLTERFNIIELLNQGLIEEIEEFVRIPKDKLYLENSILIHFLEVKSHE